MEHTSTCHAIIAYNPPYHPPYHLLNLSRNNALLNARKRKRLNIKNQTIPPPHQPRQTQLQPLTSHHHTHTHTPTPPPPIGGGINPINRTSPSESSLVSILSFDADINQTSHWIPALATPTPQQAHQSVDHASSSIHSEDYDLVNNKLIDSTTITNTPTTPPPTTQSPRSPPITRQSRLAKSITKPDLSSLPRYLAHQLHTDMSYKANFIEHDDADLPSHPHDTEILAPIVTTTDIDTLTVTIPTPPSVISSLLSTLLQDCLRGRETYQWILKPKRPSTKMKARYNEVIQMTNQENPSVTTNDNSSKTASTTTIHKNTNHVINAIVNQTYLKPRSYNQMLKRPKEERDKWLSGCDDKRINFFKREVLK